MALTQPSVTHTFLNADGTYGSGAITCTLLGTMTNGTTTIVPSEITANLNASGVLAQALYSNIDAGTTPAAPLNTQWRVDLRILGASVVSGVIVVPPIQTETNGSTTNSSKTVQLSALTAATYMVGQSITGTNIPSSTTITAVNATLNQVSISASATGTGSSLSLTLGATIDLGALLPAAQQVG